MLPINIWKKNNRKEPPFSSSLHRHPPKTAATAHNENTHTGSTEERGLHSELEGRGSGLSSATNKLLDMGHLS